VVTDGDGFLSLTDKGLEAAALIFERHTVLTKLLTTIGVEETIAAEDACRIEHVISDETLAAIKRFLQ